MAAPAYTLPTPRETVAESAALLSSLGGLDWTSVRDDELLGVAEACQTVRAALRALEARVVVEVDSRDLAREKLGWGSTADWLSHTAGIRRGQGKQAVDHARELVEERPATLAALTEGTISPEQADVVLDAIDRLPGDAATREHGEQVLLDQAARLTATELQKSARHLVEVVDPDRTERRLEAQLDREDRVAHQRRFLSITDDGAGGIRIKGRGSVEDGAKLRAALLPLTAPVPAVDPQTCEQVPDPRDYGVRMWDALIEIAQSALDVNLPPESHGARPRVAVTVDLESLRTTLDVGRAYRLVTRAIWTALVVRDRHCAFPGCTRPPIMCHAHHIVHWATGGETKLGNLVLLCGHHHRTIHHTPWRVRISDETGEPEFLPPGPRPDQEWTRDRPRRE